MIYKYIPAKLCDCDFYAIYILFSHVKCFILKMRHGYSFRLVRIRYLNDKKVECFAYLTDKVNTKF